MIKHIFLFFAFLLISIGVSAQTANILKGIVTDNQNNEPVSHALVVIKGTTTSTLTDDNGHFKIEVATGEAVTVWVSHLGYEDFEIQAKASDNLSIGLEVRPIITEEILVSGNPMREIAQSAIIKDEVRMSGKQKNVADLFIGVNGFNVIKRGGYAMDPAFRSFKYEQLNIQVDGGTKVMHACPNRMDPITTHVMSEEVERIELIKGPFSMRFGPNFGGVVNLITQNTPSKKDYGFHGGVHAGYESNGNGKLVGVSLANASAKYDITVTGELHDFGDYSDGNGEVVPSGFKSYDYSAKFGLNPGKDQRVQVLWRQSYGKDVKHAGLPMDTEHDNSSVLSIDYKKQNISDKLYSISAKGFYSYVDHLMTNGNRPNFHLVFASAPVFATTYGGKLEMTFTPAKKMILYTGLDMNTISREGDRTRTVKKNMMNPEIVFDPPKIFVDSIWQNALIADYGVFGEAKFLLNPRMTFTAGTRLDYVVSEAAAPAADFKALYPDLDKKQEINISGSLAFDYALGTKTKLQVAAGRGVRTANMMERYINHFSINIDPYEYVGNPELKPEANHQVEVSLEGEVNKVVYGANVFYSYITNFITGAIDTTLSRKFSPWLEPKNAKRFQNVDAATQAGVELFVGVNIFDGLSARAEVSYTKTKNLDFDEPLPLISPFTTLASVTYQREKFWLDLRGRFVAEQNEVAKSFGETVTPAYKTFDFRAGVKPFKGMTVGIAIQNLLDEAYYDHLSFGYKNSNTNSGRIYDPGRNITAFMKYKF